jgi:cobalt/nickel transport system permease protein
MGMRGNAAGKTHELYALELLSGKDTVVHRLHPAVKIASCVVFMAAVISFDRYALGRLCPFLFYPCIFIALGELPPSLLLKRTLLALPFCLFAGLSNLIMEQEPAFTLGNAVVSFGFLSFCALILRTVLCVAAVLILIATTPWVSLSAQLRRVHVPAIFVTLLEVCYRYISVLLGETDAMYTAYKLRAGNVKGIAMAHMGSFVGYLFLRSAARAERVYAAMKCRGYSMETPRVPPRPLSAADAVFLFSVTAFCVLFRLIDLPLLAGVWIGRLL